ncbi:MAG: serine hydrolase [Candidatus Peregrinibacteria bacterium]|nr:serine hydrolase [Candidatus Peregrinibacteria bacterium]
MLLKKPTKISIFKEFFLVFDAPSEGIKGIKREPEGAEAHPRKDLDEQKEPVKVDAKKETKKMASDIGNDLATIEKSLEKYAKSYEEALNSQVKEEDLSEIRKKAESDETALEDLQNDSEWLGVKIEDYDKKFGKLSKAYLEIKKDDSKKEVLVVKNDLDNNHKVKFGLGAGHLLPPSVASASITDLSGNTRTGKREIHSGKVGYYDEKGYIPIFGSYTIEPKEFLQEGSEDYKKIVEAEKNNHLERKSKPTTTEPQPEQPTAAATATPKPEPQTASPAPGPSEIKTPQPAEKPATAPTTTAAPAASPSALSEELITAFQKNVEKITENMKGNVAVSIFDPDTGKYIARLNQNEITPSASLIKVQILFALYKAVKLGKVKDSDVPQLQKAAEKMIADSNNASTNVIINYLGMDFINQSIQELGFKDTKLNRLMLGPGSGRNWTSAQDMTKALTLAITHEAPDGWPSAMELMQINGHTGKLGGMIPQEVKIARKCGAIADQEHYSAIYTLGKKKLIIVVMVSNFDTREHAKEGIRKIGMLVYDALKQKT